MMVVTFYEKGLQGMAVFTRIPGNAGRLLSSDVQVEISRERARYRAQVSLALSAEYHHAMVFSVVTYIKGSQPLAMQHVI